jgi:regulator of sigma E protease
VLNPLSELLHFVIAVLSFMVAVGVLVVVHEMGHFLVARWAGVKVLRFSIGFGKPLYQRTASNGTEWTLGWLPLGGYVKMLDEREWQNEQNEQPGQQGHARVGTSPASIPPTLQATSNEALIPDGIDPRDLPHAFNRQSVGKRFAIVAAGPIANFLLAIVLFAGLYLVGSQEPAAVLGTPVTDSPAALAGVTSGEQVVGLRAVGDSDSVDPGEGEVAVRSWPELQWRLEDVAKGATAVMLSTQRDGGIYQHEIRLPSAGALPATDDQNSAQDLSTRLGLTPGGKPQIMSVEPQSPAQLAGLLPGDVVNAVDGKPVSDPTQLVGVMRANPGHVLRVEILRDGRAMTLSVTPASVADTMSSANAAGRSADGTHGTNGPSAVGRIGAGLSVHLPMVSVSYAPLASLQLGARHTWDIATYSVKMFGRMLTGEASLKNLSGPVTIADYAGRSARMGLSSFLSFLALVSISLGVLNLLPIPVLDGGHLLYYAVEAVTGRVLSERWQSFMQRAGLLCIVVLSVVALFNDLARLVHS